MASIESIPIEVFHKICDLLQATDLLSLRQVSAQFNCWLGPKYWKNRLLRICSGIYPCLPNKRVNWLKATLQREHYAFAFGQEKQCSYSVHPHTAAFGIDALHIPPASPDLLFVGDRGRALSMFSLKDMQESDASKPLFTDSRTHSGWIWTINSFQHNLLTGSWDGMLRQWSLSPTGISPISAFKLSACVLCSAFLDANTVAASSNATVHIVDLRAPSDSTAGIHLKHKKAILCMAARMDQASPGSLNRTWVSDSQSLASGDTTPHYSDSMSDLSSIGLSEDDLPALLGFNKHSKDGSQTNPGDQSAGDVAHPPVPLLQPFVENNPAICPEMALFTGSNDHNLAGWDLRNPSRPARLFEFDNYPRKMSLLDNAELWIAEPPGCLHIFDVRHGQLDLVHSTELPGWTLGFGDLVAAPGCLFISGLHGVVQAYHPTFPPNPMGPMPIAEKIPQVPTAMAFNGGLLAVGAGDGCVYLWSTKKRLSEN